MENEQPEFVDADAEPGPPRPINHNDRAMFNQDVQPARHTIGDFGAPTAFFANGSVIGPPPVNRNDYEIKSSIINLVKQYQFHCLPNEHPMDHIDSFEEICSTTLSNGVPAYFLKCKPVCILINRYGAPLAKITTIRLTYNVGRVQGSFPKPLLHDVKDDDAKEPAQFIPTK